MKPFFAALVAGVVFGGLAAACYAQDASPAAKPAPTEKQRVAAYSTLGALPDWGGLWVFDFGPPPGMKPEQPSLTPSAEAQLKVLLADDAKHEPPPTASANCLPPGMPTIMNQPYDIEFLFTPARVTIIQEAYMQVRRVFTDGRGHPDHLDPTFNGHSIGHWEGDTLVVDTVGLGHKTPLGFNQLQHGPQLHTIERMHLTAPDKLEIDTTLLDPDVLAKPWHTVHTYTRHREWDMIEYICEENNRNWVGADGKVSTILRK